MAEDIVTKCRSKLFITLFALGTFAGPAMKAYGSLMMHHTRAKRCANRIVLAAVSTQADFERFVKKHQPPEPIRSLIDANRADLEHKYFKRIKKIPGLMIKGYDITRVINAQRMRRCIEMFNLDQLDVAQKYFYKVGETWRIFACYVEPHSEQPLLNLIQVQQLAKLAEETGFRDWYPNWYFDKRGKFTCIDMEDRSFVGGPLNRTKGTKAEFVKSLLRLEHDMEPEALQWLQDRITTLQNSPEGTVQCPRLMDNTQFDEPEINIVKVKQYFSESSRRYLELT